MTLPHVLHHQRPKSTGLIIHGWKPTASASCSYRCVCRCALCVCRCAPPHPASRAVAGSWVGNTASFSELGLLLADFLLVSLLSLKDTNGTSFHSCDLASLKISTWQLRHTDLHECYLVAEKRWSCSMEERSFSKATLASGEACPLRLVCMASSLRLLACRPPVWSCPWL